MERIMKCVGVRRSCRQKMLEKMYRKEEPFRSLWMISLSPADYKGYTTMQLFVNNIDIGYIAHKDMPHIHDIIIQGVDCTVKEHDSGYKHYDCFLSGITK